MHHKAAEPLQAGDIVALRPNGTVEKARPSEGFSLRERLIRRVGRLFGIRRLASYHARPVVGVALNNADPGGWVAVAVFS